MIGISDEDQGLPGTGYMRRLPVVSHLQLGTTFNLDNNVARDRQREHACEEPDIMYGKH